MSDTIGTYSFLPWLRLGVANNITAADNDNAVALRATIKVDLSLAGRPVQGDTDLTATISRDVALYGPGDIVGIDPKAVVKVEPRDWITNFEPNYLPFVEFYDEDFPWRYTPAAPDESRHRLRPWLALLVLEVEEFKEVAVSSARPLPAIEVTGDPVSVFPPADQLWAWAHVHVNRDLIQQDGVVESTNADQARARLESLLASNPDYAYSRVLSPRQLKPNTSYHAFVVPTFESGRLAGLGIAPVANPALFATLSAWADYTDRPFPTLHPVYKRWYFKTGTVGDFEYLVRLLKPRPPDSRLGRRDMDTQTPGSGMPPIAVAGLHGVLRLGGALKVPDEALTGAQEAEAAAYEGWDEPYAHEFEKALAGFVNLTDDYAREGAPDPVITPPLYGRWHALTERLLEEADGSDAPQPRNWVHELNLDPRFRVPAAFGTEVVQKNQEAYMDAAWDQVGDILAANRRIRLAQFAKAAAAIWHARHLGPLKDLSAERGLTMMAPVQRRVIADGFTLRHRLKESTVPRAALSAPFRRALRPRDQVAATLGFDSPKGAEELLEKINRGEVSAAPPRVTPEALPAVEDVAAQLQPKSLPAELTDWLAKHRWAKWVLLVVLLLLAVLLLAVAIPFAIVVAAAALALFGWLVRLEKQAGIATGVLPQGASPEIIDALPGFPSFTIRDPDPAAPEPVGGASSADSPEAARFKLALKDLNRLLTVSADLGKPPLRKPIDIAALGASTFAAIDPDKTVPAFTFSSITIPPRVLAINGIATLLQPEVFKPVMAYPEIDLPMYKPLLGLSDEHFLPNIDKIPQNTITLLETNQRFIEAYMVGLNHEFARELLWREYPTDQRGSCFRQFWDPSGVIDREGLSKDELREKLRDIPPLHTWSLFSKLGDHDHREKPGENEEEVVLVIRGELLKKYPTAVIYAQKARWQRDDGGAINPRVERVLETDGPVEDRLRTPLYEAKVDPDITFIGFDLTSKEAKGGSGRGNSTAPGWFFVIKERPGEPRFGLDISRDGPLNVWNDLAWPDVLSDADKGFLQIRPGGPTLTLDDPVAPELQEKKQQYDEDKALRWHPDSNSAELAYILYQVPVLVAVHGSEMLPN
ncbi:hypothetical protein [Bradyrhizobium oligotrophicum]|uniref:hypothetical protein n=1 Tax=Bradyrhizobium oligotrophicum TaxID=44255 RepID=UPI003EBDEF4E